MADSQEKSSAVDLKEQNTLLDLEIGKDFLSSWKSISAADGDVMDFDLPPVSKGSKKPFNFEKADMDFNLDGDFGKLPSFDMDISDLDISPPFKKDGKSNEKSKESSSGNNKGKADRKLSSFEMDMTDLDISPPLKKDGKSNEKSNDPSSENDKGKADRFSFAFDFDELENFNFEPSLARKDSKARKDKDDMESLENFNFDSSLAKEGSKAQKNKDRTGTLENLNFEPSLVKEASKAQKDEEKVESSENLNFEPSSAKEGSKTLKDKDAIRGLENFSFERSIAEEGSKLHKYKDNIENLPRKSVCQNMEASTRMNLTGSMSSIEDGHQKPSLLGTKITFDMDRQVGGRADVKPIRENYPSKLAIDEPVSSTCSAAVEKAKAHPETVIACTELTKFVQSDKSFIEPVDHETRTGSDAKFSSDFLPNNEPSGGNSSSEAPEKSDSIDKISTGSVEQKGANVTSQGGPNCNYKYKMSKISPHFHSVAISEKENNEKSQSGIENHVLDDKRKTELCEVKSQVQNSCINNIVPEILSDTPSGKENLKHSSEITEFSLVSQIPDKQLPDKETEKGDLSLTRPSSAIQLEKLKAPVQKASSAQTTDLSLSSKNKGLAQPNLFEGRRNWESVQNDRKLASLPMQHPKTLLRMELPQTKSRESCKGLEILGEKGPNIAGVQKMKILNDSFTQNLDLVKGKPTPRQRGTSVKDLHTISSLATPPNLKMEMIKKTAQTSNVQITLASLPATKRDPVETEKFSAAEGTKMTPELCSPKLSSLNHDSTKSSCQNEMRLIRNIRQTSVLLRNTPKSFAALDGSLKQTPSPLSLKRKSLEERNADTVLLYPSKRVSQSPTLSRNFMDTSKNAFDAKASYEDSMEDDCIKSTLETCQVSTTDILQKVNGKALEMSVYIENDSNIKQAEAYTKELDDICNMLRKKQEDAKELLVRATVNSNRMLMLNHHLIEQKIRVIQNSFARSLNNIRA